MQFRLRSFLVFAFVMVLISRLYPNNIVLASEATPTDDGTDTPTEAETEFPEVYYLPIQSNDTPNWPVGPQILSESAIIMEANTGAILYEKNADEELYPASITKIMTLLIALENCSLDEIVTFSNNAVTSLEADSAHIGIREGEQLTMEQCLYGLMLASANEVANAIAEHVGGSIDGFADMMNAKAAELGCQHTHFVNPHGLNDEDHYTSAYDMAIICKAALENPDFLTFIGAKMYTIPTTNLVDEERYLLNHHKMLIDDTAYTYDGCIGGKTGYTDAAYNTLVTLISKDDMDLICVTMKTNGASQSYETTTELVNYVFDNFTAVSIQDNDSIFKESEMWLLRRGIYLKEETRTLVSVTGNDTLIVPNDTSFDQLEHTLTFEDNSMIIKPIINYFYNGRFLGSTNIQFEPLIEEIENITTNSDAISDSDTESDSQDGETLEPLDNNSQDSTLETESSSDVTSETESFFDKSFNNKVKTIVNTPKYLTYLIVGFIIMILIIFIIIKLVKNHKIQKRRLSKKEDQQ